MNWRIDWFKAVGYDKFDQSQFTRAFVRCVGTTPGRYRQRLRR